MSEATATLAPPARRPPHRPGAGPAEFDEHDLYPVHEEDNVPQTPRHESQSRYLKYALEAHLPDRWVTGEVCMYWDPQDKQRYAAPDVLVVDCPAPDPLPSTYLRWKDPPPLLVVEVGSRSTFTRDEGPKLETYGRDLEVPEYLYYHPDRRELHLWRLTGTEYRDVDPDAEGRVRSETLGVRFGVDETGWLWIYTPAGERLLTHEEAERARADLERQLREAQEELRRLRGGT